MHENESKETHNRDKKTEWHERCSLTFFVVAISMSSVRRPSVVCKSLFMNIASSYCLTKICARSPASASFWPHPDNYFVPPPPPPLEIRSARFVWCVWNEPLVWYPLNEKRTSQRSNNTKRRRTLIALLVTLSQIIALSILTFLLKRR